MNQGSYYGQPDLGDLVVCGQRGEEMPPEFCSTSCPNVELLFHAPMLEYHVRPVWKLNVGALIAKLLCELIVLIYNIKIMLVIARGTRNVLCDLVWVIEGRWLWA